VDESPKYAQLPPEDLLRLGRLGRELRVMDQILSPDVDTLTIQASGAAAAWTSLDGDHISFALDRMPIPRTDDDIAIWLGTNAHELGHVHHTPRRDSLLMQRVVNANKPAVMPGIFKLWNIAEDQRQERRMLARFTAWMPYLTAALGHHLKADNEGAWMLMCGRTWLPAATRAQARALFVAARNDTLADKVAELIGKFQNLDDPGTTEADEAWAVLVELYDLFAENMPDLPEPCQPVDGGEADTDPIEGDPYPSADDDKDPDPGADEDDDDDDADSDDDDGDGTSGSGPEDSDPDADKDDGESGGDPDQPSDSDAGNGTPSKDPGKFDRDDFKRQLKDAAKDQMDADRADIDNILDALDNGQPGEGTDADPADGNVVDATDTARRLWHEVGDALLDLKDESEPGWHRHVDSGKLRPARVLNTIERGVGSPEEWFDRYEPGHLDATEMEAVVLVDVSTSMRGFVKDLGEATWAIRRAVDDLEGRLSVFAYEGGPHTVIAEPGERPDNRMFVPHASGGTDPLYALREAYNILANSEAPIRIMVILTDGDWYGMIEESERTIAAMREAKVTTVLAYLPNPGFGVTTMKDHGCEVAESIADVHGLARLFGKVAEARIRTRW
jgi:hypothetical protein